MLSGDRARCAATDGDAVGLTQEPRGLILTPNICKFAPIQNNFSFHILICFKFEIRPPRTTVSCRPDEILDPVMLVCPGQRHA